MKKLLFIINSLVGAGAERIVVSLVNHCLFRDNFQLYLLLLEGGEIKYNIHKSVNVFVALDLGGKTSLRNKISKTPLLIKKTREIKKKIQPDITMSHLAFSNIINVLTRQDREDIIITEHTDPSTPSLINLNKPFYPHIKSYFYKKADQIVAVSKGVKNSIIKRLKVEPSKVTQIYNPIDTEYIKKKYEEDIYDQNKTDKIFARKSVKIISVGRLIKDKGYDDGIKAIKLLRTKFSRNIDYIIIGEGELLGKLKQLCHDLYLTEHVHFIGWQENPFKYIAKADIFVHPSRREGFGNVIAEAMACNCVVIATDCKSGPAEILEDGKCGVLVPHTNPELLAEGIEGLIANPQLVEKYKILGGKRIQDFEANKIINEYLNFLKNLNERK